MSLAALIAGLLAFVAVLRLTHAQQVASDVIGTTQRALGVMANGDMSDDEKEAMVRRASLDLLGGFFKIAAIGIGALGASVLVIWGGAALGLYSLDRAIDIAIGWPFLLGSTVVAVALWIALDRRAKARTTPADAPAREDVPYSPLDKALHDYAFASPARQRTLGNLESRLYRRRIDLERAKRPVFVTSLPRAGTTIMLEVMSQLPQFASATYRHMPFTLSPLLWGGFSGAFRKASEKAERAHGDGIEVGFDSPEAFEEMVWMAFWPDHYGTDRIRPWTSDDRDAEFEAFLRKHMAKIVATKPGATRYLSKNNANIARLDLIETLFPDASVVLPIRNPRAQVRSLMGQHARFADLHARDPFARRYMEGIGHFEFGGALRPIDFGQPIDAASADRAEFWLRYWVAAYERVIATAGPRAVFVDHDALCTAPARHLPRLAEAIGMDDATPLAALAGEFRAPRAAPDLPDVPADLIARADDLHDELCRRAIGATTRG